MRRAGSHVPKSNRPPCRAAMSHCLAIDRASSRCWTTATRTICSGLYVIRNWRSPLTCWYTPQVAMCPSGATITRQHRSSNLFPVLAPACVEARGSAVCCISDAPNAIGAERASEVMRSARPGTIALGEAAGIKRNLEMGETATYERKNFAALLSGAHAGRFTYPTPRLAYAAERAADPSNSGGPKACGCSSTNSCPKSRASC
jgi:hypothetical protein